MKCREDLQPYKTDITPKHPYVIIGTKPLLVGRVPYVDIAEMVLDLQTGHYAIPESLDATLKLILGGKDMQWVISESYGGLYLNIYRENNDKRLVGDMYNVDLYVYLDAEMITYCKLKFSEELEKVKEYMT